MSEFPDENDITVEKKESKFKKKEPLKKKPK
jgi:hypothetical protein